MKALLAAGLGIWRTSRGGFDYEGGGPRSVAQVRRGPPSWLSLFGLCDRRSSPYPLAPMYIRGASAVCVCSMRSISFREKDLNVQTGVEEPRSCVLFFKGCPTQAAGHWYREGSHSSLRFGSVGTAMCGDSSYSSSARSGTTELRLARRQ